MYQQYYGYQYEYETSESNYAYLDSEKDVVDPPEKRKKKNDDDFLFESNRKMYLGVQYRGWGFCMTNFISMLILALYMFYDASNHMNLFSPFEDKTL